MNTTRVRAVASRRAALRCEGGRSRLAAGARLQTRMHQRMAAHRGGRRRFRCAMLTAVLTARADLNQQRFQHPQLSAAIACVEVSCTDDVCTLLC